MLQLVAKVIITSFLVVAVSEAAKRSTMLGAILASLPITSVLAMGWLWADTHDANKVAALATGVFWLILPSLALLFCLPLLLRAGWGFWPSLAAGLAVTAISYFAMLAILVKFGIEI